MGKSRVTSVPLWLPNTKLCRYKSWRIASPFSTGRQRGFFQPCRWTSSGSSIEPNMTCWSDQNGTWDPHYIPGEHLPEVPLNIWWLVEIIIKCSFLWVSLNSNLVNMSGRNNSCPFFTPKCHLTAYIAYFLINKEADSVSAAAQAWHLPG